MKDIWEIYLNIIYVHHFSSIYPTKVQLVELYDFRSHLISKKVVFYMRFTLFLLTVRSQHIMVHGQSKQTT